MPTQFDAVDSFHGSAPEAAKAWLLIGHPGPWPAFDLPLDLPRNLAEYSARALAHGVRTQLIRRTDRRGRSAQGGRPRPEEPAAVILAGGPAESRWMVRVEPDALPELLRTDPARYLEPSPPVSGAKETTALLVCTHGRREVCCAQYGGPVARALAAEYGPLVWETTHVGGDEFAANLVILPSGLYFGRLDPKEAVDVVGRALMGDFDHEHYRGTAGQSPAIQAADCLLRRTFRQEAAQLTTAW